MTTRNLRSLAKDGTYIAADIAAVVFAFFVGAIIEFAAAGVRAFKGNQT